MFKDKFISKLLFVWNIMLLATFTACVSSNPIEITRVTLTTPDLETSEPNPQEVEITATSPLLTETPTPRILTPTASPTSIETNTATITPATQTLVKVSELPINGSVLAVSADGTLVAVSDFATDALYVFDMVEQSIKWKIVEDSGGMTGYSPITFSPDGNLLAGGGVEQDLFVWDMNSGEAIYRISTPYLSLEGISFSSDNQLLAVTSIDKSTVYEGIRIYDMTTGELVDTFPSFNILKYPSTEDGDNHYLKPNNRYGEIWEAIFLPDHPRVLAIAANPFASTQEENISGGVYFWDMEARQLQTVLAGGYSSAVAVSPSGELLVAYLNSKLHGWDIEQGKELFVQEVKGAGLPRLSLTNTGLLAMLTGEGVVTIWNLKGELLTKLEPDNLITDIAFTPDDHLLVAYIVGDNSPVEVWKLNE